jgi:hypothetical protein
MIEGRFKRTGWRSQYDLLASDDESGDVDAMTAEDWDAARKTLGPGSRSLLFGTSTKVLDSIAQRFKEQAPTSGTPRQPAQARNDPLPESSDWTAGVSEAARYWRIVAAMPLWFNQGASVEHVFRARHDQLEKLFSNAEDIERFRRALDEAASRTEGITKQRK